MRWGESTSQILAGPEGSRNEAWGAVRLRPDTNTFSPPPPPTPTPRTCTALRRSGPYLAPTWRQRHWKIFVAYGGKISFYPLCVRSKRSGFYGESKYVCKT